ncbi:related to oxidoreductase, 2OG-Fe(II) oxygenase family [Rhynchosporium secalis]|uniref:Related to oxidoreductase, 2OG-Fe(II) oxygenase family n=1 Tax=Rhynchosporium secalis TaxID=38038 RepID=A0A1E1MBP3_RHYSE|nr:related to oxidoreductase, 2OG-Fe(II) oxygenase family [Rhynchosporium secalis]
MADPSTLDFPPFPSDLPHAPIASISLSKLLSGDSENKSSVLTACQTHGFFYLDLRDSPPGLSLLSSANALYKLSTSVFSLPLSEKRSYAFRPPESLFGYKPAGTVKQTDKDKRPDSTEFFNVAKDHLFGITESRSYPAEIEERKEELRSFVKGAHEAAIHILQVLARELSLEADAFANLNRFEQPAGSHLRLTHKAAQPVDERAVGLPSHTDFGSVTLLFNWLGGLQIQSRVPGREGEWDFVKPLPGHAIVNLGDAMVKFTNGRLKSAKHRVVDVPGMQAGRERISVVYFMRPEDKTRMTPLGGFEDGEKLQVGGKFSADGDDRVYTAAEWLAKRTVQLGSGPSDCPISALGQ